MKWIGLFILLIITNSAFAQSQLFELRSDGLKEKNGSFVYENDTLKITYAFWANQGTMCFKIENKLTKPLYINWKKSCFYDNVNKLDYWNDDSTANYRQYIFNSDLDENWFGVPNPGNGMSRIISNEKVTFIPPKGVYFSYNRKQFKLLPVDYYSIDAKCDKNYENSNVKPGKKVLVLTMSYTKKDSPLKYRNFITYSTDEQLKTEGTINHEFFLGNFSETETKHFKGLPAGYDNFGKPRFSEPYRKNTAFYIEYKEK